MTRWPILFTPMRSRRKKAPDQMSRLQTGTGTGERAVCDGLTYKTQLAQHFQMPTNFQKKFESAPQKSAGSFCGGKSLLIAIFFAIACAKIAAANQVEICPARWEKWWTSSQNFGTITSVNDALRKLKFFGNILAKYVADWIPKIC